jgi:hypothetical protein
MAEYENITDLINQEVNESVENDNGEYTSQDEAQARQRASQAFAESRARGAVESQPKPKPISKPTGRSNDEWKEYAQSQDAKLAELTAKLENTIKLVQGTNEATQRNSDRFITEDVRKEEEEIKKDPYVGKYYTDKAREYYSKVAREEGRYISPWEAMMATEGYGMAKRLKEMEDKEEFKRGFMEESFGGQSMSKFGGNGLDGVTTPEEASKEMRRRATKYI